MELRSHLQSKTFIAFCRSIKNSRHTSITFMAQQCAAAHSLGNPVLRVCTIDQASQTHDCIRTAAANP